MEKYFSKSYLLQKIHSDVINKIGIFAILQIGTTWQSNLTQVVDLHNDKNSTLRWYGTILRQV